MNISEILFPQNIYCINCNEPISRENKISLCKNCYESIDFLYNKNVNYDKEVMNLLNSKYIDSIDIVSAYDEVMKNLIHKIKYSDKTYLSKYFANMIYVLIEKKNIDFDYISSTPIHKSRLKQRGYNQVDLIVKYLSELTHKKVVSIATRVKETKDMYTLHLKERSEEMRNAFESEYRQDLAGKDILIVDDILTTGSTAYNLSKAIKLSNEKINIKMIFIARASLK